MVEWKKLGDVAFFYRGVTYNKNQEVALNSGGTKILRANNITLETNSLNYDDIKEINPSVKIRDNQWLYPNDILICAGSGSKEHVGKVAFVNETIGYAYGGFMGKIVTKDILNPRYLFHILCGSLFKDYLKVALNSTTINNLNSDIINNFQLPFPIIAKQQRIVDKLDTFTSSIDNLKQQIALRRKQYEYYRDQLLDLEGKEGVEMKKLGEILQVKKGDYITKKEAKEGIYPVILGGKEPAYYIDKFNHTGKAIVISRSGASAGYVSFWNEPIFVTDGFLVESKENVSIEYLYYLLKSKQRELHGAQKGGAIPHVTPAIIEAIEVALPDKFIQQRIVDILDKFEASIQNLEAQLSQREKQYEYYRNKLLTFE